VATAAHWEPFRAAADLIAASCGSDSPSVQRSITVPELSSVHRLDRLLRTSSLRPAVE
jgi:hypothetical protein